MQANRYRALRWAPLLALLFAASACAGIVVEPIDEQGVAGTTNFWGYAPMPGQSLQLEALNTSNQWEVLQTTTSGSTPTYVSNHAGYYFSFSYNPVTAPTRFRRTSPHGSTYARIHFRIQTPNLGVAKSRSYYTQSNPQGIESNLERAWLQNETSGVIRLDFAK